MMIDLNPYLAAFAIAAWTLVKIFELDLFATLRRKEGAK